MNIDPLVIAALSQAASVSVYSGPFGYELLVEAPPDSFCPGCYNGYGSPSSPPSDSYSNIYYPLEEYFGEANSKNNWGSARFRFTDPTFAELLSAHAALLS